MKRMIYVAQEEGGGSIEDLGVYFDKADAISKCDYHAFYLTRHELQYTMFYVQGWMIDTDCSDATAAYIAWLDECMNETGQLPDADFYEEFDPWKIEGWQNVYHQMEVADDD